MSDLIKTRDLVGLAAARKEELAAARVLIGDPDQALRDLENRLSLVAPTALGGVIAFTASAEKVGSINFVASILLLAASVFFTFVSKGYFSIYQSSRRNYIFAGILNEELPDPSRADMALLLCQVSALVAFGLLMLGGGFFIFGFLFA